MKERPILFSAPMVRAILARTKTQTRRALKPQPRILAGELLCWRDDALTDDMLVARCPYGQPGDRLWVRETWRADDFAQDDPDRTIYFADLPADLVADACLVKWRPSIFMPRTRCRITLEITGVRVERLQDISEADAVAEGMPPTVANSPRVWYMVLWCQLNGPGSWDANPWVWTLEFKRVMP